MSTDIRLNIEAQIYRDPDPAISSDAWVLIAANVYIPQDSLLFSLLATGQCAPVVYPVRSLPEDMARESVPGMAGREQPDRHHRSWLSYDEFHDVVLRYMERMRHPSLPVRFLLVWMRQFHLAGIRCRVVFCFD